MKVENYYGVEIDFDIASMMMDDDIREKLHMELAPCEAQEFFDAYIPMHEKKFKEVWELAKKNPVY